MRREGGRVVREYLGNGLDAELAAEEDVQERAERAARRVIESTEHERLDAADVPLEALDEKTDQLLMETLKAAGFHQHKRGEWRKRRGR